MSDTASNCVLCCQLAKAIVLTEGGQHLCQYSASKPACFRWGVSAPGLAPALGWPSSLPCSAPPPHLESSVSPAQQHGNACVWHHLKYEMAVVALCLLCLHQEIMR